MDITKEQLIEVAISAGMVLPMADYYMTPERQGVRISEFMCFNVNSDFYKSTDNLYWYVSSITVCCNNVEDYDVYTCLIALDETYIEVGYTEFYNQIKQIDAIYLIFNDDPARILNNPQLLDIMQKDMQDEGVFDGIGDVINEVGTIGNDVKECVKKTQTTCDQISELAGKTNDYLEQFDQFRNKFLSSEQACDNLFDMILSRMPSSA